MGCRGGLARACRTDAPARLPPQARTPELARTGPPAATTPRDASARIATGHEHQGDEAKPTEPEEGQGPVGECPPLPAVGLWAALGTCQVKDDLTEPVRRPDLAGYRVGG